MQTNINFSLQKVDQIFDDPKENCSGSKIIIFGKWPQVTLLYEFDIENGWNFQNMQNIAVFRPFFGFLVQLPNTYEKWQNMSTFSFSAQYVLMSLKEP